MIIAIVIGVSCLFWIIAAILFVCAKGVDRRISESKKDCVENIFSTKFGNVWNIRHVRWNRIPWYSVV